jgi:hypothetical protein
MPIWIQHKAKRKFGLPRPFFRFGCIVCLLFAYWSLQARAQIKVINPCDDPWSVCLFQHPGYVGDKLVLTIEPGMRQKNVDTLPPGFEDQVSSIKVGESVAIAVFINRFLGSGNRGLENNEFEFTDQIYFSSVKDLGSDDLNDKVSSAVVFPKAAKAPLGIWGWNNFTPAFTWKASTDHVHLFPVSEREDAGPAGLDTLDRNDLDHNMNGIGSSSEGITAILFDGRSFQDQSLTLPGQNSNWATICQNYKGYMQTNLGRFGWSDRARSLQVIWNGPSFARPRESHFTLLTGANFPGFDYRNFPAPTGPAECEKACLGDPKCKSYTWVKDTQVCWLKDQTPKRVNDQCCTSGSRIMPMLEPQPARAITMEYGYDRPGGDYARFPVPGGFDECTRSCQADPQCKAFTFVKPGGSAPTGCWLKSTVPPKVANAGMVSGFVSGAGGTQQKEPTVDGGKLVLNPALLPGSSLSLEPGVNRPGGDYGAIPMNGGPEECRQAWAKDSKCKSFTWVKPGVQGNKAVCWVKGSVPPAQQNADTVLGVRKP